MPEGATAAPGASWPSSSARLFIHLVSIKCCSLQSELKWRPPLASFYIYLCNHFIYLQVRDEQVKLLISSSSLNVYHQPLMQQAISPSPRPTHPTMSGENSQLRRPSENHLQCQISILIQSCKHKICSEIFGILLIYSLDFYSNSYRKLE